MYRVTRRCLGPPPPLLPFASIYYLKGSGLWWVAPGLYADTTRRLKGPKTVQGALTPARPELSGVFPTEIRS